MRRHRAAMLLEERAPSGHVLVLDARKLVKDSAALRVRFRCAERPLPPRPLHLIPVVFAPRGLDGHTAMLAVPGSALVVRRLRGTFHDKNRRTRRSTGCRTVHRLGDTKSRPLKES